MILLSDITRFMAWFVSSGHKQFALKLKTKKEQTTTDKLYLTGCNSMQKHHKIL